jgi:DUF1680 family protein
MGQWAKRGSWRLVALGVVLGSAGVHAQQEGGAPARAGLRGVPFTDVTVSDRFWAPRQEVNRTVSIPVNLEQLEKAGNLEDFRLAAAGKHEGYKGPVFMDSDVYKALEAASYSLATHPDPVLSAKLDAIIATVASAQQPDGYLDSHYTVNEPDRRWTNLRDNHELYCAGHLIEAAVAHYRATGQKNLLDVATRVADHIDSVFGPAPKRLGYPGHPEIELALVKLADVTGEKRYFELARFFVENRGKHFFATEHRTPENRYEGTYWQDDVPICDHNTIKGHAVRAAYLLSGTTDVVAGTGDAKLSAMLDRVWKNTVQRNMYITGGIGPSAHNEGFTEDYDLPNLTAYQETCASVALAQWNHRMALLHADAKYADVFERSLYNGVLAGVSQDGNRFFYVNPLASSGRHHRSEWFGCACCPPNVARTLASLGGYAYATSDDALWVNLYIQGSARAKVGGTDVRLEVTTNYPWEGSVKLEPKVESPAKFALRLRKPGWAREAKVTVNGEAVATPTEDRGYLVLEREWKTGDAVTLELPMPVERVVANPKVKADAGQVALQRGPLVYCVEAVDNGDVDLDRVFVPLTTELDASFATDVLGGVVVVKTTGAVAPEELDWSGRLYQALPAIESVGLTAIPYYAWDNRRPGAMRVWLPAAPVASRVGGPEVRAKVTLSFANGNAQPSGVNDGEEPSNSAQQPQKLAHWWPHQGTTESITYTWAKPVKVGGSQVYWFDDSSRGGGCKLPASWTIEYRDDSGAWKPVEAKSDYPVVKDRWCPAKFEPMTTTGLRVVAKLQPDWAAGIHEWKVEAVEE